MKDVVDVLNERIAELDRDCHIYDEQVLELKEQLAEAQKDAERLLVLATKWCDKGHHDWQEILKLGGEQR